MTNLPVGSMTLAGTAVPYSMSSEGIETALSILILVIAEAIRVWIVNRKEGDKDG